MQKEKIEKNIGTANKVDSLTLDEKKAYVQQQMNESKTIGDEDQYNYWEANLKNLQEQKEDYYQQLMNVINKRRQNGNLSEEEKKQMIGEIYYCIGYLVKEANTDEEIMNLTSKVITDLNEDNFEKNIQHHIIEDLQEKAKKDKEKTTQLTNNNSQTESKKVGLQDGLNDIKNKLKTLQEEYHEMLSDGKIDENELEVLMRKTNELLGDAEGTLMFITTKEERQILNTIINNIEEEKMKMKKALNIMSDKARTFN